MLSLIRVILRLLLSDRARLIAGNVALRQRDRIFWGWLSKLWTGWGSALAIVTPDTVVKWHRRGFKLSWRWKSRKTGWPTVATEVRILIRRMSAENPLWGAPRIRDELRLLGHEVAESTVAKYMVRRRPGPPSQTWRSFLKNHMVCTAVCDFFIVPTITFRLLYCFVVLGHGRRRIVHLNVTAHPTARWAAQQIVEAFPADGNEPRYLLRDRDSFYGGCFRHRVKSMGIREVLISPRSPWQNPYCERVIGSIRRECTNRIIVGNEAHFRRILRAYQDYHNDSRPHASLEGDAPAGRELEPPALGRVVAVPQVGWLHHRYTRAA